MSRSILLRFFSGSDAHILNDSIIDLRAHTLTELALPVPFVPEKEAALAEYNEGKDGPDS